MNRPKDHEPTEEKRESPSFPRVGTALIDGNTFTAKPVHYVVLDGMAIVEGDILLGPVEEVEKSTRERRKQLNTTTGPLARGVIISGDRYRWPNGLIPYVIDDDLPHAYRVTYAIAHWEESTNLRFIERTEDNEGDYPDYVRFRRFLAYETCVASVGRRGGEQHVILADSCSTFAVVHEIGHTAGLWHEQSREDRDCFVTIHWENIDLNTDHGPGVVRNFDQHISDGTDFGPYDYESIMHYHESAFALAGRNTISIKPGGIMARIGFGTTLSAGDIWTINQMYP